MSLNLETVARFPNAAEAEFLVIRLRDKGIHAHIANQFTHTLKGAIPFGITDLWVQVAPEDLSQAQEIAAQKLPDLDASDAAALEDAADMLATCPNCGADSPEYSEEDGGIVGTCAACGHRWRLP
ncbi:MAG: DUF2007 domain-containing protein [Armatimonas sp.]